MKHIAYPLLLALASASAFAQDSYPEDGWWEPMIGPGKPIDTDRNFVICVNSLGSCKGSTGPASIDPQTGTQYRLSFPDLRIQDIAAAGKLVLDALGIEQLRCLIGPSMGGMSGLALMRQQPDIARHFLAISTAAQAERTRCTDDQLSAIHEILGSFLQYHLDLNPPSRETAARIRKIQLPRATASSVTH